MHKTNNSTTPAPTMGVIFLTDKEVAKVTGLGASTVRQMTKDGKFPPSYKISGCTRWRATEVQWWAENFQKWRFTAFMENIEKLNNGQLAA